MVLNHIKTPTQRRLQFITNEEFKGKEIEYSGEGTFEQGLEGAHCIMPISCWCLLSDANITVVKMVINQKKFSYVNLVSFSLKQKLHKPKGVSLNHIDINPLG